MDKIDFEIGEWKIFGLNRGEHHVHQFKQWMSSPGAGQEDMAWPGGGMPAPFGWFFLRPEMKGKNRKKLLIRKQALVDKEKNRRHEAPLCGGHGLLYPQKQPDPLTKKHEHLFKLQLSLNVQRFLRHQPLTDKCIPIPTKLRLQRRKGDRALHDEEIAFDHVDNWLPRTPAWRHFSSHDHLGGYINLISNQVENDLARACEMQTGLDCDTPDDPHTVEFDRSKETYSLSRVETIWEFPSDNSMFEVFEIGKMLLHLKRQSGSAKLHSFGAKEAQRIVNSPCFTIPVAQDVHLRLYPKTNKRIRFEIIQTNLGKQRSALKAEAGLSSDPVEHDWSNIPSLVGAVRKRAAVHMNNIMEELREGRTTATKSYSAVHILSEIAAAIPIGLSREERFTRMQTLMVWVCFQRGYRGTITRGPYADALQRLKERGVLVFDRKRQYYVLSEGYVKAADSLTQATGEPLLQIFGMDWGGYTFGKDGKTIVHLRE